MPYIKQEDRLKFEKSLEVLPLIKNEGELNYLFTKICIAYINQHGLSYANINDVMGALSGCDKEFYRRVAVNYENSKIAENGDVY